MKFGSSEVPVKLFDMAREQMRKESTFTPGEIREHLLTYAASDLYSVSNIRANWTVIALRVTRACIDELRALGEIKQLNHGLWENCMALEEIA